jgi:hypothetical protein
MSSFVVRDELLTLRVSRFGKLLQFVELKRGGADP